MKQRNLLWRMINGEQQGTENLIPTKVMSDGTIHIFQVIGVGTLSNKMWFTTCYRKGFPRYTQHLILSLGLIWLLK